MEGMVAFSERFLELTGSILSLIRLLMLTQVFLFLLKPSSMFQVLGDKTR
jgi:hypothetical protein